MLDRLIETIIHFRLGFRDIIDIAIVSYILYRLILLIRGTRAEQLVKGLIILLIALVVSGQL